MKSSRRQPVSSAEWASWRRRGRALLDAYGNIAFLGGPRAGLGVLALTFAHVPIGLCGLLAGTWASGLESLLGIPPSGSTAVRVNAILVGIVFGAQVRLGTETLWLLLLFATGAVILTLCGQAVLESRGFPILSMPFSLISLILGAVLPVYPLSLPLASNPEISSPGVDGLCSELRASLEGLGSLFGGHEPWMGIALLALFFARSRFTFLYALIGLAVGWWTETRLGASGSLVDGFPAAYNPALASIALGSVYLVPSLRATLLAVIAAALTTLYGEGLRALAGSVPVYTLPFFLGVGSLVAALRWVGLGGFSERPDLPAEWNLERSLSVALRFQLHRIHLGNPLLGRWTVSQGRLGRHTHKPPWEEALDFVLCDGKGRTFRGTGRVLTDYHAFNRPVFSPVTGHVVDLVGSRPDCLAGAVDTAFPWGNYVILRTLDGYFVVLAHLRKDSVTVSLGQYVAEGEPIAAVGNSGYSPEPHLHLHVQVTMALGSQTLPFCFASGLEGGRIRFSFQPEEGATVEFLPLDPSWDQRCAFILGSELKLEGPRGEPVTLRVGMEAGTGFFFFADEQGNRLHFSKTRHYFCCFRYEGASGTLLEAIHVALPRVPLCGRAGGTWEESLPVSLAHAPWARALVYVAFAWGLKPRARCARLMLSDDGSTVHGQSYLRGRPVPVSVHWDPLRGWTEIRVGDLHYRSFGLADVHRLDRAVIQTGTEGNHAINDLTE